MELFNKEDRGQVGIGTLIVFIAMVLVAAIAAGVLINTAGFLQTQAEDTGTESTSQVADNLNIITEVGEVGGTNSDKISNLRLGVQPSAGADDINLAELTVQYVSDNKFANLVVGHNTVTLADESHITPETSTDASDVDTIIPSDGTQESGTAQWDGSTSIDSTSQAGGDTDPSNIVVVPGANNYGIDVVTAENEDDVVMTDGADRYELVIPLNLASSSFNDDTGSFGFNTDNIQPGLAELPEGAQAELTITTSVGSQSIAFLQVPDSLSGNDGGDTVNL